MQCIVAANTNDFFAELPEPFRHGAVFVGCWYKRASEWSGSRVGVRRLSLSSAMLCDGSGGEWLSCVVVLSSDIYTVCVVFVSVVWQPLTSVVVKETL